MSPSHNIIVKVENIPRIGELVVDDKLKNVGKVFDIFGPVSSPYVAVKPATKENEQVANKMLYVLPAKRRKEKGKFE